MDVKIRICLKIDLDKLQSISYETFDETFRSMNSYDTMDTYLEKSFSKNKLQAELNDPNCQFYFLYLGDDLAGYLKINETSAQTDINDPKSIELERIYIKNKFKGQGLGSKLLNYVFRLTGTMKKDYVWLSHII